jgi:hypothetical protein
MTKTQKLNTLKTLLGDFTHLNWAEAKRKELISAAVRNGLEEKDTYVALKASAKSGTTKGCYIIAEMTKLVEAAISKGTPTAKVAKARKPKAPKPTAEELGELREVANASPSGNVVTGGVYAFDALPYTEDDMSEELSLMGTYVSSM